MSAYDIQITEPAEKDLYEIGAYISRELLEPETAKKVISKIAKVINSLGDMPLRNVLVADERLAYKGIRKIIVDNYIVLYIVTENSKTVTIIRILYGKRNWMNLL
ncbi:type II toxin-antitoxin system RelE/ParE family toxin [Clostridium hydrogenum]|uniref:type II toxin-antitoxin system RelE/ParE family toxin n=1 Tax=Clostridium hydrogenum TaxID=2855764 RepID=UPI001F24B056|nr:type II toxin-antitoxin system RelE/ParE family toxin [Clostridium hydrogenum]